MQLEGVFSEGSGNILTGGSGHTFSDRSSCKHEMPVPKIRKKALIVGESSVVKYFLLFCFFLV